MAAASQTPNLDRLGLKFQRETPDGNCWFYAVARQLYGDVSQAGRLRAELATYFDQVAADKARSEQFVFPNGMYDVNASGQIRYANSNNPLLNIKKGEPIPANNIYDELTEIVGFRVDGYDVPTMGVGSLVVFNGLDEGFLSRAGRTIRAAIALENASEAFAKEPVPMMVLKSNGTNLTSERIGKLLEAWRVARSTRSTAFLNADVELQAMGIDPNKLQLNEARQYVALELCRAIGLPAYFASAETTSMTYSNATAERRSLIDFGGRNLLVAIEQRLSMPDFVGQGNEIRYSLDEYLRGNPLERAQVYEILNRIGAMSVQEIREEEDLIDT